MKHEPFVTRTILVASLLLFLLILPGLSQAEGLVKGAMMTPEVSNQDIEQIAVESVQDTLKACIGRIPSDATVEQLLLAEQNCQHVALGRTETSLSF